MSWSQIKIIAIIIIIFLHIWKPEMVSFLHNEYFQ